MVIQCWKNLRKTKDCLEKYRYVLKTCTFWAEKINFNYSRRDFVLPRKTILMFSILIITYYIRFFYTIYCHHKNLLELLNCMVTVLFVNQAIAKLIMIIRSYRVLQSMAIFIDDLHTKNVGNGKYDKALAARSDFLMKLIMLNFTAYVIGYILYSSYPLIMYLMDGNIEMLHKIPYPEFGMDTKSAIYYIYNMTGQYMEGLICITGNATADSSLVYLTVCSRGLIDCIGVMTQEIEQTIKVPHAAKLQRKMMNNLVKMHADYNEY